MNKGFVVFAVALALMLAACATDGDDTPPFTVVEENASIANRSMVRRIAIYDDDLLLIEAAVNELYLVKLFPGCINFGDVSSKVRLVETSIGIDRSSRFFVDGVQCPVRTIDRVVRTPLGATMSTM